LIIIDEERIFKEIEDKNPASVSVNGPDGIPGDWERLHIDSEVLQKR